jgi:hypothetical protein
MIRSQAVSILEDVERILRDAGRLDSLSPSQLSSLASRARSAASSIDDVVRLLKKLDREVKGLSQPSTSTQRRLIAPAAPQSDPHRN